MKAVLHIGTRRESSSRIQKALYTNTTCLEEQGIAYFTTPGIYNSRALAGFCKNPYKKDDFWSDAFSEITGIGATWREDFKSHFEKYLQARSATTQSVIFSSDHLHRDLGSHQEIERLRTMLEDYFDDYQIVIDLHRQDRVALSRYREMCLKGVVPDSILEPRENDKSVYYNYLWMIERWSHVFDGGVVDIRVFGEREPASEDELAGLVPAPILQGLELSDLRAELQEPLSAQVHNALATVSTGFSRPGLLRYRAELGEVIVNTMAQKFTGEEQLPARQEFLDFYNIYRKSNDQLAKTYLNRNHLFSDDFSEYGESPATEPMSDEVVQELLRTVFNFALNAK